MKTYEFKRARGQGGKFRHRRETTHSVLLPPKHKRMLDALMDYRGLVNTSDFFRRLLEEESARLDSRNAVYAALDRMRVRREVRASDVQAVVKAMNWHVED